MIHRPDHTGELSSSEASTFSLAAGGPLYQIYRGAHLSGNELDLLARRMIVIALFTWLPLAVLSIIEGRAFGTAVRIPFLYDVEAYVRLLVSLPLLIGAELVVHRRVGPAVEKFVTRHIVTEHDLPKFNRAIHSALRIRNSVAAEGTLFVLVYTVGLWIWRNQISLAEETWYATPSATRSTLTMAGHWYRLVSIPIFQFILCRWYLRLMIWFRLLWQISRLNLQLTAAHPDRSGGIGFLAYASYSFGPVLFAQGALMSGVIASRVLFEGRSLMSFKMECAGLIICLVMFILGPLLMFSPKLEVAKRQGVTDYGRLGNCYVFAFERKWIRDGDPDMADFMGAADIQSLADLGNSYGVVDDMRLMPFGLKDVVRLGAVTAAPLIPLSLTMFSPEELVTNLLKMFF